MALFNKYRPPATPATVATALTRDNIKTVAGVATVAAVENFSFVPDYWQAEIVILVEEFSSKDPSGDCWQWLKGNRPDLWKAHLAADMSIDAAYQEQDAGKIGLAISRSRGTHTAMIEAWHKRHNYKHYKQPSFSAA